MRRRGTRPGFALLLVVLSTTALLAAWGVAAQQTTDLVRLKEALKAREQSALLDSGRCRTLALAYGLAMLETGYPPPELMVDDEYRCNISLSLPGVGAVLYTLTFRYIEGTEDWTVQADPAVDPSLPGPGGFTGSGL